MSSSLKGDADPASSSDDLSDLEKELEDDFDMTAFREKRLEQMKKEMNSIRDLRESELHGTYSELTVEKEAISKLANERLAVAHFYHNDFRRCKIMDAHLTTLAKKYPKTLFLKLNVENVPFLVGKFEIKVLPCVFTYVKGVVKDRILGFEGLSENESDSFSTTQLEYKLSLSGAIERSSKPTITQQSRSGSSGIRGSSTRYNDDDDSD